MREIDNLIVLDKSQIKKRIESLKVLRKKAVEEQTFEIAQWIDGKIESLKSILTDCGSLETFVMESFDKGWELCSQLNVNYNQSLNEHLSQITIKQTHDD